MPTPTTSIYVAAPDLTPEAWAAELAGTPIAASANVRALYDIVALARTADGRRLSHAFMLALCKTEHQYGADPESIEVEYGTKSWGMRRSKANPALVGKVIETPRGQFVRYPAWGQSLGDCCYALTSPDFVYQREGRETIQRVIERWSPDGDRDNSVAARVAAVVAIMARLTRSDAPGPTGGPTMPLKPTVIPLPSPNKGYPIGTHRTDAIIWHITAGTDSRGWLTNPTSGASSNYLIQRKGEIYELVKPGESAWANGAVRTPNKANPLVAKWLTEGINFNQRVISIECEGFSSKGAGGSLTAKQVDALVNLTAWLCATFGIAPDRAHIFGHNQIDSVNRRDCPGFSEQEWQRWVGRVAALVDPPAPEPTPARPAGWLEVGQPDTFLWEGAEGIIVERESVWWNPTKNKYYRLRWHHQRGYSAEEVGAA